MISNFETGLDEVTEIGLYTGVTATGDVFKLEVINNYAPADANGLPNTVLQTMTVVGLNGSYRELQRTKSPVTGKWTPWSQVTDEDKQDLVTGAVENNVATFDNKGQVGDSGKKIGTEQFEDVEDTSVQYGIIQTTNVDDDTEYYTDSTDLIIFQEGVTKVYTDKAQTDLFGIVTTNRTSGYYQVTTVDGSRVNMRTIYAGYYKTSKSANVGATELGVVNYVSDYVDPKVDDLQSQIDSLSQDSEADLAKKADKVTGATANNLARLAANGNLKDSGVKAGGEQFGGDEYICLDGRDNEKYYTDVPRENSGILLGTIVYSDITCTNPIGEVESGGEPYYSVLLNNSGTVSTCSNTYYKPNDKTLATEAGVMNAIQRSNEIGNWGNYSDVNNQTTTGIYHFKGFRTNANDHLPIDNVGEFVNIAFTLIVDKVEGKYDTTAGINLPEHVSQTLFLGNRQGSETKIYVRNATTFLSDGTTTWESWKELVTSTYLGIASSMEDELLNDATEIGLYTGAIVNTSTNTFDVFKLEVINNYAVTTQVSAATGTSIPNSVLQTITILSIDGNNATKKRIGTYNGSGYTWDDWNEDIITIEEMMDDLITLDFIDVIQNGDDIITDENNLILTI